jgi:group I intron endonuclease
MTAGIYSITHISTGKRYIGKSIDVKRRLMVHKSNLISPKYRPKSANRHLYNAVQKYGWNEFCTEVIELFEVIDEEVIAKRELFWMDHFDTTNREKGFNLRRDSSTSMIVHAETRKRLSNVFKGSGNPNYGNTWSAEQKKQMSEMKKAQHASGEIYNEDWKKHQGVAISQMWKTNIKAKTSMSAKMSKIKQRYKFIQCSLSGDIVKTWNTVKEIIAAHPDYKWQNIYSVCNGHKPTYMGYVWKKEPLCQE